MAPPSTTIESIPELRRKVQAPVRAYNDVAGVLVGDRVSIHVTRLFLVLGLSPTVGTIAMLLCGLSGSALIIPGGAWAVAGFALMFAYYVFDCVDGEVARYRNGEKLVWGFHDFLFHLYVKAAFFTCLGVYAVRFTGRPWTFLIALAGLLATLFSKALYDAVPLLVARYVVMRGSEQRAVFVRELTSGMSAEELERDHDLPGEFEPFRIGSALGAVRAAAVNFDLSLLVFLAAAVIDLWLAPFPIAGITCNAKLALLAFYGVALPLDFFDRVQSYLRTGGFAKEARRFVRRAHNFRV